jgi:hypothetical protein
MEPKSNYSLKVDIPLHIRRLTAVEVRKLYSAPLATWLATVALVLIVICVALSLAAWREHQKKSQAIGAEITTFTALEDYP